MSIKTIGLALIFALAIILAAQEKEKDKPVHQFKMTQMVQHTSVKDQNNSGTCWSFGATSFFEAELIRLGKGEFDLSEMFVVKRVYSKKAVNYVRYHGKANFGEGSLPADYMDIVRKYGMVPESVYNGMNIGEKKHSHAEMFRVLRGMLDGVIKGKKLTPRWKEAFDAVLDIYMGKAPEHFDYRGKSYTAKTFFDKVLGLDLDDYVELSSFTHHPFYRRFILEIPDNWARHGHYFNVPIDDLERTVDNALKNGYSVCWDGDVSEKTFFRKPAYAVIPVEGYDRKKKQPEKEKEITQVMRQETFDNYTTSDDHLMHLVGIAHDQAGTKFYYTKNSWGDDYGMKGYWYLSRSYFRLKTISVIVHKNAIPKDIAEKLE